MMLVSKATTPEEMRDDIIKWLKHQATLKRNQARIASRKTAAKEDTAKAEVLDWAAKEIAAIVIKS